MVQTHRSTQHEYFYLGTPIPELGSNGVRGESPQDTSPLQLFGTWNTHYLSTTSYLDRKKGRRVGNSRNAHFNLLQPDARLGSVPNVAPMVRSVVEALASWRGSAPIAREEVCVSWDDFVVEHVVCGTATVAAIEKWS